MSKPDAWMPLYIGDYLADTMHLTGAEHGAALLLLMHQWMHGSIPTGDPAIAEVCRMSLGHWRRAKRQVLLLFPEVDGCRKNRRLGHLRWRLLEDPRRRGDALWAEMRAQVFARDDYTCRYCGTRGGGLECDHVEPLAKGGTHHPSNLVTACRSCNRSKGAKSPAEWMPN